MKEGFPKPQSQHGPEGMHASELLKVRNELQILTAQAQYRIAHPDKVVDLDDPNMRNEVMSEFVSSGEAEKFSSEYGNLSVQGIKEALDEIFPERRDESLH